MFEEIIEFDEKKIKERNLDINKINAYLDEIHDVPEIKHASPGVHCPRIHYRKRMGKL